MGKFLKILKNKWEVVERESEISDLGFLILRVIVLGGGYGWLKFSQIHAENIRAFSSILQYFIVYCLSIYLLLFLKFEKKRAIYVLSLGFDLSFVYLLTKYSGGFNNSFFIGFYLLTALHSFYYGYLFGLGVAVISTITYMFSGNFDFTALHWTEFSLRVSFLFLIALPLGLLSEKLRRDKEEIEKLNRELLKSIDELRKLQHKLIEAEKLSALGRLTADIAHEIRNPLTAIGGFARRLGKRIKKDTKEEEYASLISSEVERLERILRDVLSFSREAKYHLNYENINNIASETLKTFNELCTEHGVEIKKELTSDLPKILIDKDQVIQAFNNLVINAVDAMPGGGTLTIRTRMEQKNYIKCVVFDIIDTGTGIPEKKLERLFEPFYSTKQVGKGTGLGLSICKKIMDEHRGFISVSSTVGEGSVFSLYFPYVPASDAFKTQCWEYNKCGVDKVGDGDESACPAYPNYGRICWAVAGTFCEGRAKGIFAQKIGDCKKCEFYNRVVIKKDL
ncbi:MAG TPA: PAS domain-containing sensor histidine kinase [Nitrospirae bacterium]|nr:PAS domain-containing sensor histidine kinase [Nitrospirota bacterium]